MVTETRRAPQGKRWSAAQRAERAFWKYQSLEKAKVSSKPYYSFFIPFWEGLKATLRGTFTESRSLRMLDIGCGPLTILERFPGVAQRVAVDPLLNDYRAVFELPLGIEYRSGLASDVCPPGEQFDVVFLMNVLDHVQDPRSLLKEIDRLTAPGGWFISSDNCFNVAWGKRYFEIFGRFIDPAHLWHFTQEDVQRLYAEHFEASREPRCIDSLLVRASPRTRGSGYVNLFRNIHLSWRLVVPILWRWPLLLPLLFVRLATGRTLHAEGHGFPSMLSRWLFVYRKKCGDMRIQIDASL